LLVIEYNIMISTGYEISALAMGELLPDRSRKSM
jgi:hypothetical protein